MATDPVSGRKRDPSPFIEEDRYSRLRLIPWWDQDKLVRARVMVVGAGALGNEIIKNLALLGVGNLLVVDFDLVELSNLSRSALFAAGDEGKSKAQTAASAASRINPLCKATAVHGDVTSDIGLGLFRWADVVICGLDNREARLAVNRACWKVNRPWVDGATESIKGVARVFTPPSGVCYECTLSDHDLKVMAARDSCGFLAKEAYRQGHTPTTPTTSSVIAGIQVQEAIKLLHPDADMPTLSGRGFFFDGHTYDCFTIVYSLRDDCISHETFDSVLETGLGSHSATLEDVRSEAAGHLGGDPVVDLPCEMVTELRCSKCESAEEFFRLMRSVEIEQTRCPSCGEVRVPEVAYEYGGKTEWGSMTLAELGFGIMDIITAHVGDSEVHLEMSADFDRVFGSDT